MNENLSAEKIKAGLGLNAGRKRISTVLSGNEPAKYEKVKETTQANKILCNTASIGGLKMQTK